MRRNLGAVALAYVLGSSIAGAQTPQLIHWYDDGMPKRIAKEPELERQLRSIDRHFAGIEANIATDILHPGVARRLLLPTKDNLSVSVQREAQGLIIAWQFEGDTYIIFRASNPYGYDRSDYAVGVLEKQRIDWIHTPYGTARATEHKAELRGVSAENGAHAEMTFGRP